MSNFITLEGPEGAYNLFESESRTNEVVVQLKTLVTSLESLKENESDKTRMVNIDDFREAVNSRLNSSNNTDNKIKNSYRYSLDDDDESIRKFLNDD